MGDTYYKTVTDTVKTNLIKLSYVQTLAINASLISASSLETSTSNTGIKHVNSHLNTPEAEAIGEFARSIGGWSTLQIQSSGVKVKDTWLQPYFDRISYKIGIKEISVSRYTFAEASEFTSVVYGSPKEIVKATIIVDEYIPPQFDTSKIWIKYYIKIEGEDNWIRINPLNKPTIFDKTGLIVPRIINFNIPKPSSAQIEDKYQITNVPVKQLRARVVLTRPSGSGDEASITPLLKSYRIAMQPRD